MKRLAITLLMCVSLSSSFVAHGLAQSEALDAIIEITFDPPPPTDNGAVKVAVAIQGVGSHDDIPVTIEASSIPSYNLTFYEGDLSPVFEDRSTGVLTTTLAAGTESEGVIAFTAARPEDGPIDVKVTAGNAEVSLSSDGEDVTSLVGAIASEPKVLVKRGLDIPLNADGYFSFGLPMRLWQPATLRFTVPATLEIHQDSTCVKDETLEPLDLEGYCELEWIENEDGSIEVSTLLPTGSFMFAIHLRPTVDFEPMDFTVTLDYGDGPSEMYIFSLLLD